MTRLAALSALLVTAAAVGCASPGAPPGGPPDKAEPVVVRVRPESGATNVRTSTVLIQFDEVVSERPGGAAARPGAGAAGLAGLVLVSPGDGRERVSWRRTAIEIEPRNGFRRNTAYRVTLLPGLSDLRGNISTEQHEVVFSTGASIPDGEISGAVFDWAVGRQAPLARVEAFLANDTTFRWLARTDSLGRYALRDLAPGAYALRAYLDANGNRRIDEREAFDSATVAVTGRQQADFYAFVRDTIGPRIEAVQPVDSVAIRIRFDRPVLADWAPDSASLVLKRADSSVVATGPLQPAARLDSLLQRERAAADSIALAADTTARGDSLRAQAAEARRNAAEIAAERAAADTTDTLAARGPQLTRPVPVQEWMVRLIAPLTPGDYHLSVDNVPGLSGRSRSSDREFRIQKPEPRDSTAVPPGARPPARPPARNTPRARP